MSSSFKGVSNGWARDELEMMVGKTDRLRELVPFDFDEADWGVVASGILTGAKPWAIIHSLQAKWHAGGERDKLGTDTAYEALELVRCAQAAFKDHRKLLRRFLREPPAPVGEYDYTYAERWNRLRIICKMVRIMEYSVDAKWVAAWEAAGGTRSIDGALLNTDSVNKDLGYFISLFGLLQKECNIKGDSS